MEITPETAGITESSTETMLVRPLREGGSSNPRLELNSKGVSHMPPSSTQDAMPTASTNKGNA
jgi:hypothetical protein